jgi:hypothetical protein
VCSSPPPRANAAGDAGKKPPADTVSATLAKHFAGWDRNNKGRLSADVVEQLIRSPAVTGNAAAAVAALHLYQVKNKDKAVAVTRELVERLARAEAAGGADEVLKAIRGNYQSFVKHLQEAPRKLFVDAKDVGLKDVSQGSRGDCFLISTIGTAVYRDPKNIRKIFHPRQDGSVDLVFAGGKTVHLAKLTDAEIVLGSSAGMQGLWLNYLEKGVGTLWGKSQVATDNIRHGGDPDSVIALLTGHASEHFWIHKDNVPVTNKDMAVLRPKVRSLLTQVQNKHWLAVAVSGEGGKRPPGIVTDHDYAVLGFDAQKNVVHLWNPWGNTLEPKGPAGLENGYPTRGGKFFMPLDDFLRAYGLIYHETDRPAAKKK